MFDLRKLFIREVRSAKAEKRAPQDPDSEYHPSDRRGEGLEVEYQTLIATQFRRWGISTGCVTIEVRQIGKAPDGFDVFVGMVRLAEWDRVSALRVLIGLPLLESKVRKTVRGTWLADFSHFGGLWLHASEQLHHTAATGELRDLLMQLAPPSAATPDTEGGPGGGGAFNTSSLPPITTSRAGGSSLSPPSSAIGASTAHPHSVASPASGVAAGASQSPEDSRGH